MASTSVHCVVRVNLQREYLASDSRDGDVVLVKSCVEERRTQPSIQVRPPTTNIDVRAKALSIQSKVVAMRRDLHMHPEESTKEFRTSEVVANELSKMGIPFTRLDPTGVIAEIQGSKPGKTIALRADIDALSVFEKTGLDFESQNEGVMHACGHDAHTAMLLGAAKILVEARGQLKGTVRLLFQPAEETGHGSRYMIGKGALDNVDFIFGQHIFSMIPVGDLLISAGTVMAAADYYKITITGKSCHAATPQLGHDATLAAASTVMDLQTIVSREIDPLTPVVVNVGTVTSGSRFNICSGEAVLEGTVRLFDRERHRKMPEVLKRIAGEACRAFRCEASVDYQVMHDVLVNDSEKVRLVRAAAEKIIGAGMIKPFKPTMVGEDFAEYSSRVPGAFVILGGGGEAPQHSDHFMVDEKAFVTGVSLYAQTAIDYLS